MFNWLKKRFVVAETDGIKFYTFGAFCRYMERKQAEHEMRKNKERLELSRKGKHLYTFTLNRDLLSFEREFCDAKNIIEARGVIDYEIQYEGSFVYFKYWATSPLVVRKGSGL